MKQIKDHIFILIILVPLFLLSACGQVKTINLKRHNFNSKPTQVVWLQVAGLQAEHFSLLRFGQASSQERLAMENATCVGNLWNYNLYKLRPKASESFLGQINGTKNIRSECSDFSNKPFWDGLGPEEYRVGIFETSGRDSFHQRISGCYDQLEENHHFSNLTFWRMVPTSQEERKRFHYQDDEKFEIGTTYFDQTCQGERCFASLSNNIRSVWERFSTDYQRKVLIVQDFTYLAALEREDIAAAKEILSEVEKVYRYFSEIEKSKRSFLLILSSAEAKGLEMPLQGEEWVNFERRGENVTYRRAALDSLVFAQGAAAENLCGVYEEAELGQRIYWLPQESDFFPFL